MRRMVLTEKTDARAQAFDDAKLRVSQLLMKSVMFGKHPAENAEPERCETSLDVMDFAYEKYRICPSFSYLTQIKGIVLEYESPKLGIRLDVRFENNKASTTIFEGDRLVCECSYAPSDFEFLIKGI